jgi:hypothetical protein
MPAGVLLFCTTRKVHALQQTAAHADASVITGGDASAPWPLWGEGGG